MVIVIRRACAKIAYAIAENSVKTIVMVLAVTFAVTKTAAIGIASAFALFLVSCCRAKVRKLTHVNLRRFERMSPFCCMYSSVIF